MSIPASAFTTGPLQYGRGLHHDQRGIAVYLDRGYGSVPCVLLGEMLREHGGYQPDGDLIGSIPEISDEWPRDMDATRTRRSIEFLGSWYYCRECDHPQHPDPCPCDACPTCEMRSFG